MQGYSNTQIARTMGIVEETVRSHIRHLKYKYEVTGKSNLRRRLLEETAQPPAEGDSPAKVRRSPPGESG
jgi:DNA-binding NarL/FixJ family response regulator